MTDFSTVDQELTQLRRARAKDIEATRELLQATNGALPPPDLVVAMQTWLRRHVSVLQRDVGNPSTRGMSNTPPRVSGAKNMEFLVLVLADVIEQAIPAYVERLGAYPCGPAAAARPDLIEQLEATHDALTADIERLVDALQARGLRGGEFEHSASVLERRATAQRVRELHEAEIVQRQEREAAIDQKHEQVVAADARRRSRPVVLSDEETAGRGTPSAYLKKAAGERL